MRSADGAHPARIAVLAYPGVNELDLFGAYAVLAKAASVAPGELEVRLAGPVPHLSTSGGVPIGVAADLRYFTAADAVVIPGGRGAADAALDEELLAAVRDASAAGTPVYGVCSGALLIAAAGTARGRTIAVHHAKRGALAPGSVGVVAAGLVRDGRLCTVGGDHRTSVKSVDLAFQLIDDLAPHLVATVSEGMEIVPGRIARPELRGSP
ncbi:DJ-1/PfpI family protein [Saccharopolyspora sp. NPDC003752]